MHVACNLLVIDWIQIARDDIQQKFQHVEYFTGDRLNPTPNSISFSCGFHRCSQNIRPLIQITKYR